MGIDPEVPGKLDGGTVGTDSEIPGGEVNDIPLFSAAEAIVTLVQFQTGVVIIVEGT